MAIEAHNSSRFGVNLIAYIRAEMGLGAAARGLAHALTSANVPFNVLNFEQGNPSLHRDTSWTHKEAQSSSHPFTILAINPDNIFNAKAQVQKKLVKDRYTIGYWFWELPEIPDDWQSSFPLVDEVWAASRFIQDAISQKSPVPVFRVPIPIQLGPTHQFSRKSFALPARRFLFLTMSDTQSQLARKNPLGAVRAFKKAFPGDNKSAGLILKINNVKTEHTDQEAIGRLREEIKGHKNIYLLDTDMTRAEIDALLAVSDCFLSLHRSEGFGLGPAEAMSLGKPVILTKWSGNTDYMTPENSIGIDYQLVPVGKQYGPYHPAQVWADPDLSRAAHWMKRLVKEPALAKRIGRLGQETIKRDFSPEAVGKVIRKRLNYLHGIDLPPFQVFAPREGGYHESYSGARAFGPETWQRVRVKLGKGLGDGSAPLRVDPGNRVGIVDIAGISLRSSETGEILWRLKTRAELATLMVGGTAVVLPHARLLRLFSFGDDPQILLPALPTPTPDVPLVLEVWVRLETSSALIAESLDSQTQLKEKGELRAAIESLQQRLTYQEKITKPLQEELAVREMEHGELQRKLREETNSASALRQELSDREKEQSELREICALNDDEHLRLQEQIKNLSDRIAETRREMWDIRVRRAHTTARLKERERMLQEIQTSFVWKLFKPIQKLQKRRRRLETKDAKIVPRIAFAIDLPETWTVADEQVLITGWCFCPTGEQIVGVRAKVGRKSQLGSYGLERSDVVDGIGHGAASLESGFIIKFSVPPGESTVRLEAITQGGDWQLFCEHQVSRVSSAPNVVNRSDGERRGRLALDGTARPAHSEVERALAILDPLFARHATKAGRGIPHFSVITATHNSKISWLTDAARSLLAQTFTDWEWCIVDDGSTKTETRKFLEGLATLSPRLRIRLAKKGGISSATNQGLALASGRYACFMDHDDLLAPGALGSIARKLDQGFDVVYTDEDKLEDSTGALGEEFFKPDWSPEYLRGVMYVGHLLTVQRRLAREVGFDAAFDGVQDFEFMLRLSETQPRIGHVPQISYHWRKVAGSIAENVDAKAGIELLQQKAVNEHLKRVGLRAEAKIYGRHRLRMVPRRKADPPNVSIIIPTKDAPSLLIRCLGSIYEQTTYPRFQVILMDNGTTDALALETMRNYPVQRVELPGPFNFSRANNRGSERPADGFLVFLNNDTEVLTPDWLEHLLYYAEQPDIGAVGPLLVYEDRTVQHAGVALGMRGTADHVMRRFPLDVDGYAGSLACAREVSAVTGACMMMSKSRFDEVGRFNEYFATAYQDVDLCLRLRERGLRIIYTPQAVLVHHESVSRKSYYDMVDRMFLLDQWETCIEAGDPYYNRNLDLERGDYSLAPR